MARNPAKPTGSLRTLENVWHNPLPQRAEIWLRETVTYKISSAIGLFPKLPPSNHTSYRLVQVLRKVMTVVTMALVPLQLPTVKAAFEVSKFMTGVLKLFWVFCLFSSLAIVHIHLHSFWKVKPVLVRRFHEPILPVRNKIVVVAFLAHSAARCAMELGEAVVHGGTLGKQVGHFNTACHDLSDMIVMMIVYQFCGVVDNLREILQNAVERMSGDVRTAVRCSEKIHALYDAYNDLYGRQIAWAFVHYLIKMIFIAYYAWASYSIRKNRPNHVSDWRHGSVFRTSLSIPFIAVPLCLPISTCQNMKTTVERFYDELFQVMRKSEALCKDKKLWLYVTVRRTATFSACGFFTLGYPLITSIIAAATTYLVILVQFSIDDG